MQLVGITNLFLIVLINEDKLDYGDDGEEGYCWCKEIKLEGRRGIESESSLHPQRPSL
jgi:hypothetical protein